MNKVSIDSEFCKECGYCMNFCPKKTIFKKGKISNKKGYYFMEVVDTKNCIGCGTCATVCPEAAITVEKNI